ncbi:transposon Tn2501 resolvase [Arthrobacter sp. Hiyo1]|uniref:recombinase family protein n=1 Tax=Arthrobacter sp. Hiyo1 TaxID=1588020 RepID=UPI00072375B7|nr:recombinase family protein [Arthrobacter sp. Hiyo1]GAP57950.1 transposon Tn2501 resolvase [Arthrobacter sp. Hiyo1]
MAKVIAYVRVSTDKQELENQRYEIQKYCDNHSITVDEWDEEVVSGTVRVKDRKVGALLDRLEAGDMLIVSEISRISRSIVTVLNSIQLCIDRNVQVVSIKENITFADNLNSKVMAVAFGLAAEIERSMISARTKEALARKKSEGVVLGRPAGSYKPEHYKLHGKNDEILAYMEKKVSIAAIARLLDVNRKTLQTYIDRNDLRGELRWRRYKQLGV